MEKTRVRISWISYQDRSPFSSQTKSAIYDDKEWGVGSWRVKEVPSSRTKGVVSDTFADRERKGHKEGWGPYTVPIPTVLYLLRRPCRRPFQKWDYSSPLWTPQQTGGASAGKGDGRLLRRTTSLRTSSTSKGVRTPDSAWYSSVVRLLPPRAPSTSDPRTTGKPQRFGWDLGPRGRDNSKLY